jgi:hypothetical protein
MFRNILCVLFTCLSFTAQAQTPPPTALEFILNDESKPPAERSVAIIVGLHSLANQATADPVITKLGDDARAYALVLKEHGGFDTIVVLEDEMVTSLNVRRTFYKLAGDGKGNPSPKFLLLHWGGPALDDYTLMVHDNNDQLSGQMGGMALDLVELGLWPMTSGHTVVTLDAPPGSPDVIWEDSKGVVATTWRREHSAAMSPAPGCTNFTQALTATVQASRGRRLSINDMAVGVTQRCGAPLVHMPIAVNEDKSQTPRLPDSATMIPLGDVRDLPAPVSASPPPKPLVAAPKSESVSKTERKIPRGVGYALTGAGVVFGGLASYEAVRLNQALETRNTTLDFDEYAQATKQANTAAASAGVLGTLAISSLTVGLVVTF